MAVLLGALKAEPGRPLGRFHYIVDLADVQAPEMGARRAGSPAMPFLFGGDLSHIISTYGYGVVAGMIALESMGIPLPGETTLIAAAILAGTGRSLDIWRVIAAAAGGAILGDNIGF